MSRVLVKGDGADVASAAEAIIEEARRHRRRRWIQRGAIAAAVGALVIGIVLAVSGDGGASGRGAASDPPANPSSGALPATGGVMVTGQLVMVGGPSGGRRNASGTVTFTPVTASGTVEHTTTQNGSWQISVPPGTYEVTASQPPRPAWRMPTGGLAYGSQVQAVPVRIVVKAGQPMAGIVLTYQVP